MASSLGRSIYHSRLQRNWNILQTAQCDLGVAVAVRWWNIWMEGNYLYTLSESFWGRSMASDQQGYCSEYGAVRYKAHYCQV